MNKLNKYSKEMALSHLNHSKMKKGISPLIAWILLVGFVVMMGAFITNWSIQYIRNLPIGEAQEKEIYCSNVQLDIPVFCKYNNNSTLRLDIKNKGNYNITRLVIHRETTNQSLDYCFILNQDISPTSISDYHLNLGAITSGQGCNLIGEESSDIIEVSIVPAISIKGVEYTCSEKKISLTDYSALNRICQCSDGINNDVDRCTDYIGGDSGCSSDYDDSETDYDSSCTTQQSPPKPLYI